MNDAPPVGELRDELPTDLQPELFADAYEFPDNSRRRIPGVLYLLIAAACVAAYVWAEGSPLVNGGLALAGAVLAFTGVMSITSGWRMQLDEKAALVAAQPAIGFPVGHASAQQVWHGLRSRPTWRVLCYSADDPPQRRAMVLVDAVDGRVLEHLTEDNPESWGGR